MAAQTSYILTVDLGTSGPKVALFDTHGRVIDSDFAPTPFELLPNGGAEQKPSDWWNAIMDAMKRLLNRVEIDKSKIEALCCTSQWSGTVAIDQEGKPLMNAIIWMDSRGAKQIKNMVSGGIEIEGYEATKLYRWIKLTAGAPTSSGKDSIAHILYIRDEHPDIYQQTYKFLEPKDYLNYCFTGKIASSFDTITLCWVTDNRNINDVKYSPKLLKIAGVEREKFPDLKQSVDILGPLKAELAQELGLSPSVKVIMGTPDVQSAALGSGAVKDFQGHLYIGTSSWLTCHVPFKKTDLFHNMATLPSAIPGRYFIANEQEVAGECLNYLRDNIFFPDDDLREGEAPKDFYKKLDELAVSIPAGSEGLMFTPWLYGERSPVDDHYIRGGFFHLSLRSTRAHMARAVLEGVAFNAKWLLKYVEKMIGKPFPSINLIGGGGKSAVWSQIFADVLNRPINQMEDPILANSKGAAYLASVALGYLSFDEVSEIAEIKQTYHPNPQNRKLYDQMFEEFLGIYKRNQKAHKRLLGLFGE